MPQAQTYLPNAGVKDLVLLQQQSAATIPLNLPDNPSLPLANQFGSTPAPTSRQAQPTQSLESAPDNQHGTTLKNLSENEAADLIQSKVQDYLIKHQSQAIHSGEKTAKQQDGQAPLPAEGREHHQRLAEGFNGAHFQLSPFIGSEDNSWQSTLASVFNSITQETTPSQHAAELRKLTADQEVFVREYHAFLPEGFENNGDDPSLNRLMEIAQSNDYQISTETFTSQSKEQTAQHLRATLVENLNKANSQIVLKFSNLITPALAYSPGSDSVEIIGENGHVWMPIKEISKALSTEDDSGAIRISKDNKNKHFEHNFPDSRGAAKKPVIPLGMSKLGRQTLATANYRQSYDVLNQLLANQKRPNWCNITSASGTLNAIMQATQHQSEGNPQLFTQHSFLNTQTDAVKPKSVMKPGPDTIYTQPPGLSLGELHDMVTIKTKSIPEFEVKKEHAGQGELGKSAFRENLKEYLKDPSKQLIVNFIGNELGRSTGGHFSPVGAYNQDSDSVLVMDTAGHQYEGYFWVSVDDLYDNMSLLSDGEPRGWLAISYNAPTNADN